MRNSPNFILCDVFQDTPRILLPKTFRRKAFNIIHFFSHAGIKSSGYLIKQRYHWLSTNKDIKE